jgi:hypothetical protein
VRRLQCFVVFMFLAPFAGSSAAQPATFTPQLAQRLVVQVLTISMNAEGEFEQELPTSGILFGYQHDTLYVACSKHQLVNAAAVYLFVPGTRWFLRAEIPFQSEKLDLAVLKVILPVENRNWTVPRTVPQRRTEVSTRDPVFALGCPEGRCWQEPEPGFISGTDPQHVLFRTYYLKPGISGGPLVDTDGAVLGMIVRQEVGEGRAIAWSVLKDELAAHGFPINLANMTGYRLREVSLRAFGAVFPQAGVNSDGRRLQRGSRVELAFRAQSEIEVVAGVNRLSFAAAPFRDREVDWEEAYAHTFFHIGARFTFPLTGLTFGRRLPDVASFGLDVLVPFNREAHVVSMGQSDSVDLRRGEYVDVRTVAQSRAGISIAYRGSYRIALKEGMAVVVAPSLYAVNIDYLESGFRGFLEVGGEIRLRK